MKIRRTWLALTTVTALGVGALAVPAIAQDADDPPAEQSETPDRDGLRAEIKERAKEILAEELGVTVEELEAAHEATRERIQEEFAYEFEARREEREERLLERIDRAVENGRITEEEAAALRERVENGEFPFDGLRHRRRGPHGPRGFFGGGPFDGTPPVEPNDA
ncbi:MAG: hypothetical protein R3343_11855 [Nitriliruptorales bacterium]|nr:hypothetical protein [Nitriliruptorales bacterium]